LKTAPVDARGGHQVRSDVVRRDHLRTLLSPTQPYPALRLVRTAGPKRRPGLFRWLVWVGLVLAVAPAARYVTPSVAYQPIAVLTLLARTAGLAGGYLLLVETLLMCRLRMLERWLGSTRIRLWHRGVGMLVPLLVAAHVALAVASRMLTDHAPAVRETVHLLTSYRAMGAGLAATVLLLAIAFLAVRPLRRRMPYELWYYIHTATYVVIVLAYLHEFLDGRELRAAGLFRSYWLGLYVLLVLFMLWGRVIGPLRLNLRHRLRVAQVVPEGPNMISIYFSGRKLDRLHAKAGQYFRWRFLVRGHWWQAHPFSLSAAPNGRWLRITVKMVGDHTHQLRRLRRGVRVFAEGPSGDFTVDRRRGGKALLIAGGSGIAPIRALLEELPRKTVVIYRSTDADNLMLRQELDWLARLREAHVWYVTGPRTAPEARRMFTRGGLRRLVPDVTRRDVYLCGPTGLVLASLRLLHRAGVPQEQIHLDPFEL
jgi:predicted ferric reductase